jgi:hypothetical protein
MKTLFLIVLFLFSSLTMADQNQPVPSPSCKQSEFNSNSKDMAQSGCCSYHGGVCGCSGGRAVCCDGAFSPSCGCHADDVKDFWKSNESEQPKS